MDATATTTATSAVNKIELFQLTKKYYHHIGIMPSKQQPNHFFNRKNVFIVCFCLVSAVCMLSYFIYEAKLMNELAMTFYSSTATLSAVFYYLINIFQRDRLFQMIENLENFIKKRSNDPQSQAKYHAMNKKIEKMSKLVELLLLKINIPAVMLPVAAISLINYYIYNLGEESFSLPCPLMMPFSWKTQHGYISAIIFEALIDLISLGIYVPIITFFTGSCWIFICILKDSPNLCGSATSTVAGTSNAMCDTKLKTDFSQVVQFYSDVKQLIEDFNALHELLSLTFFLWMLLNIASILLVFEAQSSNLVEALPSIFTVFTLMVILFMVCDFGESVTYRFERFNRRLCNYKWYLFPTDMQRMYLIFVADTQQPVAIATFAEISCTRETLKKTSKAGFSYYTTLRQIRM